MCAAQTAIKQPAVFVAHGGGPLPLLNHPSHKGLISWLQQFPSLLKTDPKAILVISAHWEVCPWCLLLYHTGFLKRPSTTDI